MIFHSIASKMLNEFGLLISLS